MEREGGDGCAERLPGRLHRIVRWNVRLVLFRMQRGVFGRLREHMQQDLWRGVRRLLGQLYDELRRQLFGNMRFSLHRFVRRMQRKLRRAVRLRMRRVLRQRLRGLLGRLRIGMYIRMQWMHGLQQYLFGNVRRRMQRM